MTETRTERVRGPHQWAGAAPWLYAKVYGRPDRQAELLTDHLPALLAAWDEPPVWWFSRYRDPEPHLRLRIALAGGDGAAYSLAARRVGSWAASLRGLGLLRDVSYVPHRPATGRWGAGPALTAAEAVFAADSHAAVVQLTGTSPEHRRALTAASLVAIATGFSGGATAGLRWLIDHAGPGPAAPEPRPVPAAAVRLADPAGDWAALRSTPGGGAVAHAWELRRRALVAYRAQLRQAGRLDTGRVLAALLHAHHLRAAGADPADRRESLRLARAAALFWRR
ncbi:thiopeptide-type bacteriocin biosynthesis protein [Jiangella anatolica]|uniref:Thiopeptide-type bacteriocin biosynthesis domain-containing protein n=1 Tax=Jiangella anatolica TaxID=2670374 RepID=A0A2W2BB47_9ACTN|nr:thiopeptide-type bacteriocin biosynthesis protein [Jiangella anatolica]PZF83342.1 hypothetical protein C1I92_12940 [Jiangella anatolica]